MQAKYKDVKPSSEMFFLSPSNMAKNLFYYVTVTGKFYYKDTFNLKRENYNSFLILHIIKGSMKVSYDNVTFTVKTGETVIIDCHKPHQYSAIGEVDTIWLHYDGFNAMAVYNELYTIYNSIIIIKNSSEVINRIYKIYDIQKSGKKTAEAIQSAHIARILGEFFSFQGSEITDKRDIVDKITSHIEENYSRDLSIHDLSQIAGLSEYYFSRLFKKQTGYTLHEYIIKTRITSAKILLKSTNISLREIAYCCGFSNESSFSNTFKKITNMTPGSFRNTEI